MVKYNDISTSHPDSLDTTFGALADPTRRAILARLAEGEAQVTELAAPFGMSLPAVSKHLKVLEKAQLITRHKSGRVHRFRANPEPIKQAMRWVEQYQHFWQQQLDSLAQYLANTENKETST